jgi:hypothetical protein
MIQLNIQFNYNSVDDKTLSRYGEVMKTTTKRVTIYFDPEIHRALRLKAVETERSLSDLVNEAARQSLLEDAEDLLDFDERKKEPSIPFEDVVKDLKRRGKI